MLTVTDPCDHGNRLEDCLKLNNQLKLMMDLSPNLILLLDDEGNFVYANNKLLNLVGVNDDEALIGKPIRGIYENFQDESFVLRNRLRLHRLKSGNENEFVEDDDIFWPTVGKRSYQITFRRMAFHENEFDRILIVFNDVTDVRLQEGERRMKDMLNSTLLPCTIWDENGQVIDVNKEAIELFSAAENISLDDFTRVFNNNKQEFQADGRRTEETRQEFIHDALNNGFARAIIQLQKLDGTPIHLGVSSARVAWLSGYRLMVYYHDLTAIMAKEQEAKDAEERIRIMLDSTPLICIMRDENNNFIDCNQEALNVFGFTNKEEFRANPERCYPEFQPNGTKSMDKAWEIRQGFLEGGNFDSFEWMFQTVDGTQIPVKTKLVRIPWHNANRFLSYSRDLRDEKKMLAELCEADERAQVMFKATPLACSLWDRTGKMVDCNAETLRWLGLHEKSDYDEHFYEMQAEIQPDGELSTEKAPRLLASAFKTGCERFEWMSKTAGGEPLPLETTLVRVPWKDDYRVAAYSRDLREDKENEQRMLLSMEQNRELEIQKGAALAASELKSRFLATMSHEIRTPMNTIIGLLDLMRTDNLDEGQNKFIRDLKRMSEVLLQIINDILDFHKIESNKLELLPVHFNLDAFINEQVSRHQFLAESKNLEFKSILAPDLPHTMFGDEIRIGQIITNLISNAIKYTQKGHVCFRVDKTVKDRQKFIIFTVEDTGIGIKKENFSTLFEEFVQFDKLKHRNITGTGLGLGIAKHLIDMMGGQILLKSKYGEGSTFIVQLPLVEGDPNQVVRESIAEKVTAKPGTQVLVVDDNSGNIIVAVGMLARHGIVPDTAESGKQAVEMIQAKKYDLVFMDHMMPEMDGIEAVTVIRKLDDEYYRKLPIIALSANAVVHAQEEFIRCGMNDFVSKPIISSDLNLALARWLPKEKITAEKTEPDNRQTSLDETSLNIQLQQLTKIEDLSITSGLSWVGGDKRLYLNVIRQFCNSIDKDVNLLKSFVHDEKWAGYAIRVHAIKSILATIGNQFLADWALRLEEASTNGDTAKCIKENDNFCNSLLKFQVKLLQTDLMANVAPVQQKKKVTRKALKTKLEQLLQACYDFQPETAEPLSEELLGVSLSASKAVCSSMDTSLAKVYQLIHAYDYDEATSVIENLLRVL